MPPPIYVTVASGQGASDALAIPWQSNPPLAVFVPSLNVAAAVQPQFTETSGTAPFVNLQREDGSGAAFTVCSGIAPAFGVIPRLPTPWGRLNLVGVSTSLTGTNTLALYTL